MTTKRATAVQMRDLDRLFAGRPWWEGSAIQFLCRFAAYGGQAIYRECGRLDLEARERRVVAQALDVARQHGAEIADVLERCPERRFPWWMEPRGAHDHGR